MHGGECGEEVVRGNVCTMVPGDAVPYGADWCAVLVNDRLVLYATHRDGTVRREVFTHPEAVTALRQTIALIRPPAAEAHRELSAAAD